jgi:hypothetical protein
MFTWPGQSDEIARLGIGGQANTRRTGKKGLHHLKNGLRICRSNFVYFKLQGTFHTPAGTLRTRNVDRLQNVGNLPHAIGLSCYKKPHAQSIHRQPQRTIWGNKLIRGNSQQLPQDSQGLLGGNVL